MKYGAFILCMLLTSVSYSKTIKISVIDTGFDFKSNWNGNKPNLCKTGHKDFTNTGINDTVGHGTHVAGLISKYANKAKHCLLVYKFYDKDQDSLSFEIEALKHSIANKVDIINLSLGGYYKSMQECSLIKKALDKGILVVAAAGNDGENVNNRPYYPAMCDKRVIVVQNVTKTRELASTSNYGYGLNFVLENGTDVISILPDNKIGELSGTSQATAIITGKLVKLLQKERKK